MVHEIHYHCHKITDLCTEQQKIATITAAAATTTTTTTAGISRYTTPRISLLFSNYEIYSK